MSSAIPSPPPQHQEDPSLRPHPPRIQQQAEQRQATKNCHAEYVESLLRRTLHVRIRDRRLFVGELKCTDAGRNLVLSGTAEYRPLGAPAVAAAAAAAAAASATATQRAEAGGRRERDRDGSAVGRSYSNTRQQDQQDQQQQQQHQQPQMDALPGSRFREEAALVDPDTNELLFPPRPSSAENPSPEPQDHFALSDPSSAPSSQPSSRTGSSTSSSGFEGLQYPRLPAFGPELPADVDRASRRFVGLVVVPGQYIVGIGVQGMPVPELRADGR